MVLACLAILKSPKEKQTLEEIYLREGDDLLRYARVKLKDDTLAEDMVADCFLKLAQNLHRYEHLKEQEIHRLMVRILQNRIIDWQRKEGREVACLDGMPFSWTGESKDASGENMQSSHWTERAQELYERKGGLEEHCLQQEAVEKLMEYVKELPKQSRRIFLMCHYAGFKPQEIAKKLGLPIRTVNQQLYRTRGKLRERMEKDGYKTGEGYL